MMVRSTGAALGDREQLASFEPATVERHTRLGTVGNPALRDALGQFDIALTELTAPLTVFDVLEAIPVHAHVLVERGRTFELVSRLAGGVSPEAQELVDGFDDAASVVDDLASRLGLPVRDVLVAADVSRSTFYSWKSPDAPRPRVSSQGRLWALAQTVEDLEQLVPGSLRQWLLSDRSRRVLLMSGEFDALVATGTPVPQPLPSVEYIGAYAVGGDRREDVATEPKAPRRRTVAAVPVRRPSDRRRG